MIEVEVDWSLQEEVEESTEKKWFQVKERKVMKSRLDRSPPFDAVWKCELSEMWFEKKKRTNPQNLKRSSSVRLNWSITLEIERRFFPDHPTFRLSPPTLNSNHVSLI